MKHHCMLNVMILRYNCIFDVNGVKYVAHNIWIASYWLSAV